MPARRRAALPDDLKAALKLRLAHIKAMSDRAVEDFHIEVYLMNRSGLTFEDIAEVFATSSSTVSDWKKKGDEAYQRRHRPA
jgi:DNA-directed RNA polymerase specialized sigma24 family protein